MPKFMWPAQILQVAMPLLGDTVNSAPFVIPQSCRESSFHIPTLAGGASCSLQALDFQNAETSPVWRQVFVFNVSGGTITQLTGMAGNQVTTLPTAATGVGNFRLVATGDQSGAPVIITVILAF